MLAEALKRFYEALRDNKREVNAESITNIKEKLALAYKDGDRYPEDWHNFKVTLSYSLGC